MRELKKGYARFFHGGWANHPITEIRPYDSISNDVFGGLFALGEPGAYGDGTYYYMDVPIEKILTNFEMVHGEESEAAIAALHEIMGPFESEEDFEIAYTAAIEDRPDKVPEEDLMQVFDEPSWAEAEWAAQRVRGQVAYLMGYQAVSMFDENGSSWLVLPGVEVHQVPRENPASPALKESQKQTKRLSTKHAKARRERTPLQEIRARELKKIKRQDYYKVLATVKESVELERKGVYKITDPMGVLDDFLFNVLARQIEWSMEDIAQSGFPFLCYGLFEVTAPVRDSVRATYFGRTDHVRISAPRKLANRPRVYGEDFVLIPKKHNENLATRFTEPRFRWTIAHELGHRLHRKFESYIDVEMALEVFESKDKGAFVSRYARKNVSEMIAEAFACYIMPNYYLNKRKVSATRVYNCLKNFSKYIKVPTESPKKRLLEMTRVNPL